MCPTVSPESDHPVPDSDPARQAMQRHYEHYKNLADRGELKQEDAEQWRLALERKDQGLVE